MIRPLLKKLLTADISNIEMVQKLLQQTFTTIESIHNEKPETPLMRMVIESVFKYCVAPAEYYYGDEKHVRALRNAAFEIADCVDNDKHEHAPAYHNRVHFIFVQLAGRMIEKRNTQTCQSMSAHMIARHAVINLIHDLGHNGSNNNIGDHYVPMMLETIAFDIARPILEKHGVDVTEDMMPIFYAVMATDSGLPHEILQDAYKHHFSLHGSQKRPQDWYKIIKKYPAHTWNDLYHLVHNLYSGAYGSDTCYAAACMADADIFPSFGMGDRRAYLETQKLDAEWKMAAAFFKKELPSLIDANGNTLPGPRLFALMKIVGCEMASDKRLQTRFLTAGARLLGDASAQSLQAAAEHELGAEATYQLYKGLKLSPR